MVTPPIDNGTPVPLETSSLHFEELLLPNNEANKDDIHFESTLNPSTNVHEWMQKSFDILERRLNIIHTTMENRLHFIESIMQ